MLTKHPLHFGIPARGSKGAGELGRSMCSRERYGRKQGETDDAVRAVARGKLHDLRAHAVPHKHDVSIQMVNQFDDRIGMASERERSLGVPSPSHTG